MINEEKIIYVYADWVGELPVLFGKLYVNINKGKEITSFGYSNNWLAKNLGVMFDPDINFYSGDNTRHQIKLISEFFRILAPIDGVGFLCEDGNQ